MIKLSERCKAENGGVKVTSSQAQILTAMGIYLAFMFFMISVAAIAGDTVNYHIGYSLRHKVESKQEIRFIKREYLEKTQAFFERHGGKTIIIARFIPIIRTFAPFVSGVGKMSYLRFLSYNAIGGISWVALALFTGFFFGNIKVVKDNFSLVVIVIVLISVTPAVIVYLKNRHDAKKIGKR
jgi:membrane-associated protein